MHAHSIVITISSGIVVSIKREQLKKAVCSGPQDTKGLYIYINCAIHGPIFFFCPRALSIYLFLVALHVCNIAM